MPRGVHQCLVYSLAMLLDESPERLIQELGHTGMVKEFDGPIPHCYNGHHIQEVVELCLSRGYSLTPVEYQARYASALAPTNWKALYPNPARRFCRLIAGRRGILIGAYKGRGHAVAWDGHIVWDPNGIKYPLEEFKPLECWILAITS